MILLEARNVSKSYGAYRALKDVSLHINDGEFVSIVGPNGAGKTTLVNVLTGLAKPNEGSVHFTGQSIAGIGPVRLASMGMARAFQLVNIFPELTVEETISVAVASRQRKAGNPFRSLGSDAAIRSDVARVAEVLGLSGKLDTLAATLSQGEKKLLDIASAFALRPTVILLDEPTSGVASRDKYDIMELLVNAASVEGVKAIIQVEHDMDLVARYSDRIIALQEGAVIGTMKPDDFFASEEMISTVIGARQRPVHQEVDHA
jgi:branched-chain amino acid transport system ATP-binding protein